MGLSLPAFANIVDRRFRVQYLACRSSFRRAGLASEWVEDVTHLLVPAEELAREQLTATDYYVSLLPRCSWGKVVQAKTSPCPCKVLSEYLRPWKVLQIGKPRVTERRTVIEGLNCCHFSRMKSTHVGAVVFAVHSQYLHNVIFLWLLVSRTDVSCLICAVGQLQHQNSASKIADRYARHKRKSDGL